MPENQLLTYHLYRAQSDADYPMENVDLANLPGVINYLQTEIISGNCNERGVARKFGITRVLRILFQSIGPFGRWEAFDWGKGSNGGSPRVGCKKIHGGILQSAAYFSAAGDCATMRFDQKTDECKRAHRGGRCPDGVTPDGKTCFWSAKVIGEVDIDELDGTRAQGFKTHADWCTRAGDRSKTAPCYWDAHDIHTDWLPAAERVTAINQLFEAKYGEPDRPPPECVFEG